MASCTQIVQDIYANFGKGNIAAIADTFADDIHFRHAGAPDIPYAKDRHGKREATAFFGELADSVEVQQFEPQRFVEQGNCVVACGRWAGRAKRTGKSYETEWVMVWTFDDGKVSQYQGFDDTLRMARAFAA
jgi:ketosteroid isomerase-like protein